MIFILAVSQKKTMEKIRLNTEKQLRISSSQIDQLERENARVVEQLKEVIKMNSHWQRYDSQREEYVLKLTRTNRDLQDKVSDLRKEVAKLTDCKAHLKERLIKLEKGRELQKKEDDPSIGSVTETGEFVC